jgi:hypothetical protein
VVKNKRAEIGSIAEIQLAEALSASREANRLAAGGLPANADHNDILRFVATIGEWAPYALFEDVAGVAIVRKDRLPADIVYEPLPDIGGDAAVVKGSFVASLDGAGVYDPYGSAQGTVFFNRVGNTTILRVEEDITGESDTIDLILHELPHGLEPQAVQRVPCGRMLDAGQPVSGWAEIRTDGTIWFTLSRVDGTQVRDDGEFTAAGLKGLLAGWTIVYEAHEEEIFILRATEDGRLRLTEDGAQRELE